MTDVHLCCWASQPDIEIACDGYLGTPGWGPRSADLPDNVHLADDGRRYTFDAELVTCSACIAWEPS